MSEKLGLRFEFRVGLEMAVTAANAADRDVFAAKHSVPKGLVGAQLGRSQGAVATGEMFDLVGRIRIEKAGTRVWKRMFRKRLFPKRGLSGIM